MSSYELCSATGGKYCQLAHNSTACRSLFEERVKVKKPSLFKRITNLFRRN